MLYYSGKSLKIQAICWWTINIILINTAFLSRITFLSNISIFLLIIIAWNHIENKNKEFAIYYILSILSLFSYSLILENNILIDLRFSIILLFIGLSYFVALPKKIICKPLASITVIYSVFLIIGEFYFVFLFDESLLGSLRHYLEEQNIGDIYPKYGNFYAIQLLGTSALPFVYMLAVVYPLFKKNIILKKIIILAGIVISGNFAYIAALFVFYLIHYIPGKSSLKKHFNKFILSLLFAVFILPPFLMFLNFTLERKKEVSNAIRIEQATLLLEDLNHNIGTTLFGQGLGNTLTVKTKFRDYTGNQYFELQSLYFLNQMGLIPFIMFICWNIHFTFKYVTYKKLKLVYLGYLTYAITNPYILNTTQIVVIITLVSLSVKSTIVNKPVKISYERNKGYRNCRALLS